MLNPGTASEVATAELDASVLLQDRAVQPPHEVLGPEMTWLGAV